MVIWDRKEKGGFPGSTFRWEGGTADCRDEGFEAVGEGCDSTGEAFGTFR